MPYLWMRNYFIVIKCAILLALSGYLIVLKSADRTQTSIMLLLYAITTAFSILFEILKHKKKIPLIAGGIFFVSCLWTYPQQFLYFFPIVMLDIIAYRKGPVYCYLFALLGMFRISENKSEYIMYAVFLIIIYAQHYIVIQSYKDIVAQNERKESELKSDICIENEKHHSEVIRSRLYYENQLLQERAKLAQILHDKLGHNINGSLYQLEAGKILMDSNPEKVKEIMQNVIDVLRNGMDEIRALLRNERPDKKSISLIQLNSLCEECREQYGIDAKLITENDIALIPENVWNIILDNAIEAVTNSLKYAECTQIIIQISVLNKVVRCYIEDNGKGCKEMKDGMGIQGMRLRMQKVNGYLDFESQNGFQINMLIPLQENVLGKKEKYGKDKGNYSG